MVQQNKLNKIRIKYQEKLDGYLREADTRILKRLLKEKYDAQIQNASTQDEERD